MELLIPIVIASILDCGALLLCGHLSLACMRGSASTAGPTPMIQDTRLTSRHVVIPVHLLLSPFFKEGVVLGEMNNEEYITSSQCRKSNHVDLSENRQDRLWLVNNPHI
ncbi:hypothetical protein BO94DRAFT_396847 [Aspergillus sclerotioniger CBS 115572]|uniref:Uncharacterized protein n=1 Tax=Aspergillus sclerotioniger CBS 115572 TaxID=1450535 RepID=A0A317WYU5_9EURO|nr:hypothetical protein BO94DRAFT_396847 [Aspergillus sclerotioniger CBS 115572]PWY91533.1 hypothetical protein BO94DRAFT_396847 [Aspergillus sclerotioniger CBS 115572]